MNFMAIIMMLLEIFSQADCLASADDRLIRRARRKGMFMRQAILVSLQEKQGLTGRKLRVAMRECLGEIDAMSDDEIKDSICEAREIKARREAE